MPRNSGIRHRRIFYHPCSAFLASFSSSAGCFLSSVSFSRTAPEAAARGVNAEISQRDAVEVPKMGVLKEKIELLGITGDYCAPGQYCLLLCPKCKGGWSMERSLSFHLSPECHFAMWRCFNTDCGWAGETFADSRLESRRVSERVKFFGHVTEESLGLQPLGSELVSYFKERGISKKTLERNAVMQRSGDQAVIAFTYRRNGQLVGCKYRTMAKRFWQERGTEKIFYGLDDICDVTEIIIVEGEIDKLSMEEAGFQNCVSVPGGAPSKVSSGTTLSPEKESAYKYLWSCKDYLDDVSRIILATDADEPGQALAKGLANRLGKDRCWRVCWPKKDEFSYFKDANEVLKHLGPGALKRAVENAESYLPHISTQVIEAINVSRYDCLHCCKPLESSKDIQVGIGRVVQTPTSQTLKALSFSGHPDLAQSAEEKRVLNSFLPASRK